MKLKIIRHKNHGNVMNTDNENGYFHKFYFSFFKLNNRNIVSVMKIENFKNNKLINTESQYNYANNYKMGENFFMFWERSFNEDLNEIKHPVKAEKILIKSFLKQQFK